MRRQVLTLFVLVSGIVVTAQQPTLREMLIEAQADVNVLITGTSPAPVPFAQLVQRADHVVRATIGKPVSQLSEDGFRISTTFALTNQRVLFTVPIATSSPSAGTTVTFTLTQPGGTMSLEGFKATVSTGDDTVSVREGMDVILLLKDWKGQYVTVGDDGIFEIRDSKVVPLDKRRGEHHKFAGMDVNTFVNQIGTLRQQPRQK
jgi:hypothetical protein